MKTFNQFINEELKQLIDRISAVRLKKFLKEYDININVNDIYSEEPGTRI